MAFLELVWDVFYEDCLILFPILFLTFFFIEYLEHRAGEKFLRRVEKAVGGFEIPLAEKLRPLGPVHRARDGDGLVAARRDKKEARAEKEKENPQQERLSHRKTFVGRGRRHQIKGKLFLFVEILVDHVSHGAAAGNERKDMLAVR